MFQAGVAIVEREAPVESLIEVHFGSGKAEALALLRDLGKPWPSQCTMLSLPAHAMSRLTQLEITLTRCSSF